MVRHWWIEFDTVCVRLHQRLAPLFLIDSTINHKQFGFTYLSEVINYVTGLSQFPLEAASLRRGQ